MNEERKIYDTEVKASSSKRVEVGKDKETKLSSEYFNQLPENEKYIVSMTNSEFIDLQNDLSKQENGNELGSNVAQAMAYEVSTNKNSDVTKGIQTIMAGYQNTMLNDGGRNAIKDDEDAMLNHIQYGDKNINIRPLTFKSSGGVNKSNISIIIANHIKTGDMIQIPLWHSGFHITLRPMTLQDSIDLQRTIASKTSELGYRTFGYLYNMDSALTTKVILDLIDKHIQSTSLKLQDDKHIFDYISVYDINPLILGFLRATYPNGVEMVRMCGGKFLLDDNGALKEPYMAETNIDLAKLLWVNTNKIDRDMYNLMCRTTPNSISIEDSKEYKRHIYKNDNSTYEYDIKDEMGNTYTFGLKIPSISEYLESSESIINNIVKSVNDATRNKKDEDDEQLSYYLYKNKYLFFSHFLDSIAITNTDGEVKKFSDHSLLLEIVNSISDNLPNSFYKEYNDMINKFTDKGTIALVAIPRKLTDNDEGKGILIPFNLLTFFFHLSNKRLLVLRETSTISN